MQVVLSMNTIVKNKSFYIGSGRVFLQKLSQRPCHDTVITHQPVVQRQNGMHTRQKVCPGGTCGN
jgi:hypothetical protein